MQFLQATPLQIPDFLPIFVALNFPLELNLFFFTYTYEIHFSSYPTVLVIANPLCVGIARVERSEDSRMSGQEGKQEGKL